MVDLDPGWVSGKLIASSTRKGCPNTAWQTTPFPFTGADGRGFGWGIGEIAHLGFDSGVVCILSFKYLISSFW